MFRSLALLGLGALLGALALAFVATTRAPTLLSQGWMRAGGSPPQTTPEGRSHAEDHHDEHQNIALTDQQIAEAGIEVAQVSSGVLTRRRSVPGTIIPDADRIARVAVRLLGTVAELRKRLGDPVDKDEVVAVIESREVADAKSEYLAVRLTHELQQTLFGRASTLWQAKVMTENDYLRARATAQDARVKFDTARQKLFTLGLTEDQIADLPNQSPASLSRQELRSPIAGRIAERRVDLGSLVGREGQESELYVVADLSELWVDLAVPPADLQGIREGLEIAITVAARGERLPARIVFVSPLLDRDTRAARVIASIANPDLSLRPGTFVTAEIPVSRDEAAVVVPKTALQTIKGVPVVFVRSDEGFDARKVTLGLQDERAAEIVSGLAAGDTIAVRNTFILKADLGKAEAEHQD